MPKRDDWDARFAPEAKRSRRRGDSRSQGILLMLIAIGIPLVVFFIQVDGALRFSDQDKIFERTLTNAEQQEIRAAIDKHKAKLDAVQRLVEDIKESYRGETGASYERDVWVVHVKDGLAIPFKYVLAFGAILFLIGIGKLSL
ncbi:MAG: hypothetical protein NT147_07795 [Candidatus Aminicenantes bacterium]|nr:hypothetical protein [Candidatus Aminicenantes bacterium]